MAGGLGPLEMELAHHLPDFERVAPGNLHLAGLSPEVAIERVDVDEDALIVDPVVDRMREDVAARFLDGEAGVEAPARLAGQRDEILPQRAKRALVGDR